MSATLEIERTDVIDMTGFGVLFAGLLLTFPVSATTGTEVNFNPRRIYSFALDPRENPDFSRRATRPPRREIFGPGYEFTTFRHLDEKTFERNCGLFVTSNDMGRVVWPDWGCLMRPDLPKFVEEFKKRGLVFFDPWGYVPGNDESQGFWRQFHLPQATFDLLERELGERWTGMDNGEQDNRYHKAFVRRFDPHPGRDRFRHYLNFRRYFEHFESELGNRLTALVGCVQTHSLLREGVYTMVGAETSQAYPNTQLLYSFIRGAGKQYGVPWFGNVSIYNGFGWKNIVKTNLTARVVKYEEGRADRGTSLAMMKKLAYQQMFYNCWLGGFESGFFYPDGTISPIGVMQKDMRRWAAEHGDPGVQYTPVALMTDVFAGWNPPRLANWPEATRKYRVWGALPYEPGDYLTHGVYDVLYPGYADSHFFHDERGLLVPTPYGDIADCLLSDAPDWLLAQYAVVVLAGRIAPSAETADTLRAYVRGGGHLVMTHGNERTLFADGFGVSGAGKVTVIPSEWGVETTPQCALPVRSKVDEVFPNPYPLTAETRRILQDIFASVRLFGTGETPTNDGLATIVCRRGPGEYTLCVLNNTWTERPLKLWSACGEIESVTELPTDVSERSAIGFLPHPLTNVVLGVDSPTTIAAGAVRLFRVRVNEGSSVAALPKVKPPANPVGRTLAMNGPETIREFVLRRPTFFRHWDGVKVSAAYLLNRDRSFLEAEGCWCRRQGLHVMVDFTDLLNGFPDMRLLSRDEIEAKRTWTMLEDVLAKAPLLGVRDCVLALHPTCCNGRLALLAENRADMEATYRKMTKRIADAGLTAHLRMSPLRLTGKFSQVDEWIVKAEPGTVKPSASLAAVMAIDGLTSAQRDAAIRSRKNELWLLASAPRDVNGTCWSYSAPLAEETSAVLPCLKAVAESGMPVVFDAAYPDPDAEYRDAKLFETVVRGGK